MGAIVYLNDTPEQLRGSENDTRASVNKVMSGKWVKFQIWGELTHSHLGAYVQLQKNKINKWLYGLTHAYQSTHGFVCARK